MSKKKRAVGAALFLAVLWGGLQAWGLESRDSLAQRVVEHPDVTFSTRTVWACTPRTWDAALDHPLLMGALWQAFGYAPAYRISGRPDSLHVVDPTGLEGDAFQYQRGPSSARFLVRGRLHHWAVPVLNRGNAVFVLDWRPNGGGVSSELTVYVKAGNGIGSLVLRLVRPLLSNHVERRVRMNLRDAQKILSAVEKDPQAVAQRLPERNRGEFEAVFAGR